MTKERLKNLRSLIREAAQIQNEIEHLPYIAGERVADTVKDYSTGYARMIKIEGYSMENYYKLKRKLQVKRQAIIGQINEAEEWLESVDDCKIRDVLRRQYIEGDTQEQIAEELGYDVRTIKRWLAKFWKDVL